MLLKEFPDIDWLKSAIQKNFSDQRSWDNKPLSNTGWPTAILNVTTTDTERPDIKGPFSIFINLSGKSQVRCDQKSVELNSDTYLISNHNQHYDLRINNVATETFNIHFGEKLYEETLYSWQNSNEELLNNPMTLPTELNHTIRSSFRESKFNTLVTKVQSDFQKDEKENSLYDLLSYVLLENHKHFRQVEEYAAVKASTKTELIKRIYLAVDFIHACYHHPITLEDMAEVALMSKFHFLRVFKAIFKLSPHQYIKQIRIQKAIELVKENRMPLYLIAQEIGLENGSSLSRLIHQTTGQRPTAFQTN